MIKKIGLAGLLLLATRVLAQSPTFSPGTGIYSSTQNVSIICPAGQKSTYTLDGTDPNIASTPYVTPIAISTNTTLRALCANIQVQHIETQKSYGTYASNGIGYKCVTVDGQTYPNSLNGTLPLNCEAGGGVVGIPSNVSLSFDGTTQTYTMATTSSTGETHSLVPYTDTGCDSCTYEAQDFYYQPIGDLTVIANNEVDAISYDHVHGVNRQIGLQCNQQSGTLQWQLDSGGEGWKNTHITDHCPNPAGAYIHLALLAHWDFTTGCGGAGCLIYDAMYINGVFHDLTFMGTHPMKSGSFNSHVGNQGQIDLTNTAKSGHNPTVGGRLVRHNNIAGSIGPPSAIATATFTFSVTPVGAVSFGGNTQLSGKISAQ